jgi:hypothetical protein
MVKGKALTGQPEDGFGGEKLRAVGKISIVGVLRLRAKKPFVTR